MSNVQEVSVRSKWTCWLFPPQVAELEQEVRKGNAVIPADMYVRGTGAKVESLIHHLNINQNMTVKQGLKEDLLVKPP